MAVGPRQLKPSMLILLCVSSASWADPGDDMLPPPPVPQSVNDEAVFQLALIVNHYDTGLVVPVTRRQAEYLVASADLRRAGLPAEHVPPGEVNVSRLKDVRAEYDSTGQRLLLNVPREWVSARVTPFSGQMARSTPILVRGRCSTTTSIPTTLNTAAARPPSGMNYAILTTGDRYPPPVT